MALYGVAPSLPQELQERRSQQATGLQAAQAQMGVPGQAPPGQGGGGGQGLPSGGQQPSLGGIMQQRREQASQLQARQQDLQVAERLLQVLDPRLPKPARQFLFKELSRQIGIDPKGERSREIGAMLTSLDPQVLEQVRSNLGQQLTSAEPGQVMQMTKGVLSGQVPVQTLVNTMSVPVAQQGAEGEGAAGGSPAGNFSEGRMSLGGPGRAPNPAAGMESPVVQAQAPGLPGDSIQPGREPGAMRMPFEAAPVRSTPPQPAERTIPPLMRETAPEMTALLGLEPGQRYRNVDVMRGGWSRIPSDYEGQQRMASDIRGVQDGVVNMTVMGNQLVDIIRGRPEVLNLNLGKLPIPFAGTLNVELPNPASAMVQIGDSINGAARAFGWRGVQVDPQSTDGNRVLDRSRQLAERVATWNPELQQTANDSAVMQSLLINIAFAMAATKGQTGRFLSDRDVELQLQELGKSANAEQFSNTVARVIQRAYDQYRVRMRSQTGGDLPLTNVATEDARAMLLNGQVTPRRMVQDLGGTGNEDRSFTVRPRPQPTPGNVVTPDQGGGGTLGPDAAPGGGPGVDIGPGMGISIGGENETFRGSPTPRMTPQPLAPQTMPDIRSPIPAGDVPSRTPGPLGRQSPTIEEEENVARTRAEEDRAAVLADRSRDERRTEIQESQERRAARNEVRAVEEARRQRIREAFASIASAFRSGSSAGVGVSAGGASAGGDQDAAAFRIAPPAQRRPPTPIDASRFQLKRQ